MPSYLLELVEKPNGDIVLQRSDDEGGEPLVVIHFSKETRVYLVDNTIEVARAMIQAGIHTAAELAERGELKLDGSKEDSESAPNKRDGRIIH